MRYVVIEVPAQKWRIPIDEDEEDPLRDDDIFDYYVYSTLSDELKREWKVEVD